MNSCCPFHRCLTVPPPLPAPQPESLRIFKGIASIVVSAVTLPRDSWGTGQNVPLPPLFPLLFPLASLGLNKG